MMRLKKWLSERVNVLLNKFRPAKAYAECPLFDRVDRKYAFSPQREHVYNPELALWLSGTLLKSYRLICSDKLLPTVGVDSPSTKILYNFADTTQKFHTGFIGRVEDQGDGINRIVISVAGTMSLSEWVEDFEIKQIPFFKEHPSGPLVHKGFHEALTGRVNKKMTPMLSQIVEECKKLLTADRKNEIYMTGHSLGAGMVRIAAAYLAEEFKNKNNIDLITYLYGLPRAGDRKFAKYEQALAREFKGRYIMHVTRNHSDMVPETPFPQTPKSKHYYQHPIPTMKVSEENRHTFFSYYLFDIHNGNNRFNHIMTCYEKGILKHPAFRLDEDQPSE